MADIHQFRPRRNRPGKQRRTYYAPRPIRKRASLLRWTGIAAVFGLLVGTASVAVTPGGSDQIMAELDAVAVAVAVGLARERAPQQGDYWPGCDAARAAGTAPIYRGEPGYREGMDGDDDGIACEPYHGS